jgi:L-ribulose-5-phosphate 3-epimerase
MNPSKQRNLIGIMQGRLSPPVPFRMQAFPTGAWQEEFERARVCGLDAIEWLFEADDGRGHSFLENPLWSEAGRAEICSKVDETSVLIKTCCADYFMPHPFFRVTEAERLESIAVLNRLIVNAAQVGVQSILLPVLEISEIRTADEKALLLQSLRGPLHLAEQKKISLGLETELPADQYLALVEDAHSPALGVYYDTGNNAAQGHDIAADANLLASRLVGIHVKDRKRGGSSVLLGQGDADFQGFFKVVKEAGYIGPVIIQAAFGTNYLETARRHRQFVEDCLK